MRRLLALLIAAQLALVGTAPAFGQEYAFPPASTGGGGGTGCVPSGSAGSLLTDDGAGACTSNTTGTGVVTALGVNTGSAGSVVLNGGALGTPSSGTLTNATGLPISTGVSGLGTGVATFLGTASSANLASALTDETGTGSAVFGTSPTISSPTITGSAVTFTSGTSRTIVNAAEIIVCTSTCTITTPASATAGMQFCVQNDDNVSTVITLAAVSGVQYENTARTSYKSANTALASSGAVKDQICMVAISATKWNVFSSVGTWN